MPNQAEISWLKKFWLVGKILCGIISGIVNCVMMITTVTTRIMVGVIYAYFYFIPQIKLDSRQEHARTGGNQLWGRYE
jgi:hypothetical protein